MHKKTSIFSSKRYVTVMYMHKIYDTKEQKLDGLMHLCRWDNWIIDNKFCSRLQNLGKSADKWTANMLQTVNGTMNFDQTLTK